MATNPPPEQRGLMELLGKAVLDIDFRKKLFQEPDAMAKQYQLSTQDTEALKKVDPKTLEAAATQMASKSEVTISIVIRIHF
jgi:hypothetical protein